MIYTPDVIQAWHGHRLAGKKAVVTGAGRGIGKGVALMCAAQGAEVLACDINSAALDILLEEATAAGFERFFTVASDLTDEEGASTLADAARKDLGTVNILINAAAIVVFDWIETMRFSDWRKTISGELDTVFLVTQAIWPFLKEQGGSIINFSSANAHVALATSPALAHCAGKGGVLAMTRQMAMEGGPHGIRANSIAPGFTLTEETERHLDNETMMSAVKSKLMIDRLGTPTDIGWMAVYLASEEARYVTAADFCIDGGATAW
ncbi:SDR family oxidoreductase [Rhizobium sp.]|jgi:NAD(P)-dependent dehydrogenase (short-subunit alcohol dehydrogenase family)|uniref:SDR family NAD(P)-dependent oxidoreductase n=1 Tax=Rhizobium sp. TaxID=391 RepID=UPI000E948341|nr:oxidoreductase [Rhizobium sp.]